MSSPDVSRRAALAALLGASALLAGCDSVRPLYGTLPGGTGTTRDKLAAVKVTEVSNRVDQVLRNELVFAMTGGGEAAKPLYELRVTANQVNTPVGVEILADVPTAYILRINADFSLTEIDTGLVLTSGTSFASASYDFSTQRFANLRAKRDAEDRAAKSVAQDIRTRVAAYFATAR